MAKLVVHKDLGQLWGKFNLLMPKRHYYQVYIWKSREAMVLNTPPDVGLDFTACCSPAGFNEVYELGELVEVKALPKLGELHFVFDGFGIEAVSHEIGHAFFHWLRIYHRDFDLMMEMEEEEPLCYLIGEMNKAFWKKYYEME